MRNFAILLCLICAGYYGWDVFRDWLELPEESYVANNQTKKADEIFPSAMKNITPVKNIQNYIEEQRLNAQQKAKAIEQQEQIKQNQEDEAEEKPVETVAALPVIKPQLPENNSAKDQSALCFKLGPLSTRNLPAINRSIEAFGLLEAVRVESVLSADSYVVFTIPSATSKGARALANQIRRQGYPSAKAVDSGPLLNAVELGRFKSEEQAQDYLQSAQQKLKMNDLRLTRMIGSPTNQVNLIFGAVTEQQAAALKKLAAQHRQPLQQCDF